MRESKSQSKLLAQEMERGVYTKNNGLPEVEVQAGVEPSSAQPFRPSPTKTVKNS